MADEQRIYSDEEFALVLRKAAELSLRTERPGVSPEGLTLAEMKAAAAQAGLDPALVERAARLLTMQGKASTFERFVGGPLRHEHDARFRATLNADGAARVLAAVRFNTDFHSTDPGRSSELGMIWKASGDGNVLSVVARPDAEGTSVSVVLDRRGTFLLTGLMSGIAMFGSLVVATGVASVAPSLAQWAALAGIGGTLAFARRFWASSTRKARERMGALLDTIAQALPPSESGGTMDTTVTGIPRSIQIEHEAIHAALLEATQAPGRVGAAARELADVLHPHFVREEQIALPPLGLLAALTANAPVPPPILAEALAMSDALKAEMPRMLDEHTRIRAAVEKLLAVARAEQATKPARVAEQLALHAQTEEEVLYPAAILVGDIIRARSPVK